MKHRTDSNQKEIVSTLQKLGAEVVDTSKVGYGFPDLVVSYRGEWHLIEVKTKKGKLLKSQKMFHGKHSAPVHILRCIDDAVAWARIVTRARKLRSEL